MKRLVLYCRWNNFRLRLLDRREGIIQGQLVTIAPNEQEGIKDFRFDTSQSELVIYKEAGPQVIILDEMGIPQPE